MLHIKQVFIKLNIGFSIENSSLYKYINYGSLSNLILFYFFSTVAINVIAGMKY